jgi:outer membrane receptor for ferrienterochelin and colicins
MVRRSRRTIVSVCLFAVLTALSFSSSLHAAQATAGAVPSGAPRRVEGTVADPAGLPIPGVTVALRNTATGLERLTTTGSDGRFVFEAIGEGAFRVGVAVDGFSPASRDVTTAAPLAIVLTPAAVVQSVTVVSAARQAELRDSLSTPVTVVGRTRLHETARASVGEALREVPGVLTRRGSEGTAVAGEQVQGIDSRQVLVLVDGQPVAGARGIKSGAINLDRQSTYRLDRVEVVKGAASAMFGSDAIGGVVNMITREPGSAFESTATVSGGGHGTFDLAASGGGRQGRVALFGTASRGARDSFDLTPQTPDTTGVSFARNDAFAKAVIHATPSLSLSVNGSGYWNSQRGTAVGEAGLLESVVDDESQALAGRMMWQAGARTSVEARGYATRFDEANDGTLVATGVPQPTDRLFQSLAKADASIGHVLGERHMVQGGLEVTRDRYRGLNRVRDADGHTATTGVVWLQDRVNLARWLTLTLGGRYDHHSIFGSAFSPKAAVNARVVEGMRIRASYGEAFRAPDLGQLFYRFVPTANFYQVIGNPALEPETASSWQAGADYAHRSGRFRAGINAFRNRVHDLIESYSFGVLSTPAQLAELVASEGIDPSFAPAFGRQLFMYRNIAEARTQGVEADGEIALGASLQAAGAYTYLEARDLTRNVPLTGRHRHHGVTRLTWTPGPLGLRAEIRGTFYSSWIAAAGRGTAPAATAPRFALWDAYLAKRVVKGVELFGAVDNLGDNQDPNTGVLLANGTPAPIYRPDIGRTVRVGLKLAFDRR